MTAQEAGSSGRRVLVVDDSVDTARMMKVLLKRAGFEVRVAHDGPGAIEASVAFGPEIVLLDLTLPGMTGQEVAMTLRAAEATAGALIVAISGYGDRGVPPDFDGLLIKPVDHDALLELLRQDREGRLPTTRPKPGPPGPTP